MGSDDVGISVPSNYLALSALLLAHVAILGIRRSMCGDDETSAVRWHNVRMPESARDEAWGDYDGVSG